MLRGLGYDQREGARELLDDVERDHDPGRLGKGGVPSV